MRALPRRGPRRRGEGDGTGHSPTGRGRRDWETRAGAGRGAKTPLRDGDEDGAVWRASLHRLRVAAGFSSPVLEQEKQRLAPGSGTGDSLDSFCCVQV